MSVKCKFYEKWTAIGSPTSEGVWHLKTKSSSLKITKLNKIFCSCSWNFFINFIFFVRFEILGWNLPWFFVRTSSQTRLKWNSIVYSLENVPTERGFHWSTNEKTFRLGAILFRISILKTPLICQMVKPSI